jgi:hypothetical protein
LIGMIRLTRILGNIVYLEGGILCPKSLVIASRDALAFYVRTPRRGARLRADCVRGHVLLYMSDVGTVRLSDCPMLGLADCPTLGLSATLALIVRQSGCPMSGQLSFRTFGERMRRAKLGRGD